MAAKHTQHVSLTPDLQRLIGERIASGHYRSASEVVRAALRLFFQTPAAAAPAPEAGDHWSRQQLTALFAQSTAGLAVVDLTGRFTWVNDRYCAIVGRSREELLQLRMQDITHPEDLTSNLILFAEAAADDPPFEIEKRYIRPDGSAVWVNNSVSPVRGAAGKPESILAVCVDITARKDVEVRLRGSEALKKAILDAALDSIITVTDDSRIVEWNPVAERTFGYTAHAALGQDLAQLIIPPELRERHYTGMVHTTWQQAMAPC